MDYRVMKRPMFRVGGPTSGGTGITSGLDTPKRGLVDGPGGYAGEYEMWRDKIPGAFEKRRTGLENQMGSIGPMALYSALSGGALEGVSDFGDLAKAFGDPAVLQSVVGGMSAKNKLQSKMDDVDLKEATTMATLMKPTSGAFSTRLKSEAAVKRIQGEINILKGQLVELDPVTDADKIDVINKQIGDLNQRMRVFISGDTVRQQAIAHLVAIGKAQGDEPDLSEESIAEMMKIIQGYKDGGRISKQMGGGFDMASEQPVQPQIQPQGGGGMGEDPFQILRKRLPPEISDEVVSLIAYNKAAFQDFANIQDQDDVDLFNQKYNVQLVVDMASR